MSAEKSRIYRAQQEETATFADKQYMIQSENENSKQLLNAVELNSFGTTTLLNVSSSLPRKGEWTNLESSPPKHSDLDETKGGRKRKLELYENENNYNMQELLSGNTSVIYSSSRRRQLKNNNLLLGTDLVYSSGSSITQSSGHVTGDNNYNSGIIAPLNDGEQTTDAPDQVTEYQDEIFANLFILEKEYTPIINPCLVDKQNYINYIKPSMRAILIDWLLQVHKSLRLSKETLLQGISLMDRYLAINKVTLKKLQLLAITSLFTAAKFEEVKLPKLKKYCYMTDNAYTTEQMVEAEMAILKDLDFKVSLPGPFNFMTRFMKVVKKELLPESLAAESSFIEAPSNLSPLNNQIENCLLGDIAEFFLEFAITSPKFIAYKHSYIAAMSIYIIRMMFTDGYPQLDTHLLSSENSKASLVFNNKINNVWTHSMVSITNGIENDILMKESITLLIQEIISPSTKLPTLLSKWEPTVGKCVTKWCQEVSTL